MKDRVVFPDFPCDCEMLGYHVAIQNGCYSETLFYIRGHRRGMGSFGYVKFINGLTGPETEIRVCRIAATTQMKVHAFGIADVKAA